MPAKDPLGKRHGEIVDLFVEIHTSDNEIYLHFSIPIEVTHSQSHNHTRVRPHNQWF